MAATWSNMVGVAVMEKAEGRSDEQGMLFATTVKVLLLAAFLELVLFRLVSRLGMHLSKLASEHEWIRVTFEDLSRLGLTLLNIVSILVLLALCIVLLNKTRSVGSGRYDMLLIPSASLITLATVALLCFPPETLAASTAMLISIGYNVLAWWILGILTVEYLTAPRTWGQRAMVLCYGLGLSGWLYYQIVSMTYSVLGFRDAPLFVHEAHRLGEALMVLASILVFWAYGGVSLRTKNKQQRRRTLTFALVGGAVFLLLLFMDYFAGLYDPAVAQNLRKGSQGIGWIFQMGMGYTFYLPFAFYVVGLLCWAYTVIKLVTMGRLEGVGIGLMFLAGYALQLSHQTLMVLLGVTLLTLERRRVVVPAGASIQKSLLAGQSDPLLGQRAS